MEINLCIHSKASQKPRIKNAFQYIQFIPRDMEIYYFFRDRLQDFYLYRQWNRTIAKLHLFQITRKEAKQITINVVKNRINGTLFNSLRPRQDGRHFPDDIFNCIFFNEKVWIFIKISLLCVPKCPINNIPSLVQIMAWRRPGDRPLSEQMMFTLLTQLCVTRPQWVKWASR